MPVFFRRVMRSGLNKHKPNIELLSDKRTHYTFRKDGIACEKRIFVEAISPPSHVW
jgi:hypothetical protein